MWNPRVDEAQAGINIAGRNINNFRRADDTTLWKWRGTKEPFDEGETGKWKSWLKINIQKNSDHSIQSHRVCVHVKLLPLYLSLCNPMACSPPGSSVCRIFQAKILEWVSISYSIDMQMMHSNGKKWRGTKEPFDEGERREWKPGLKLNIQKTNNNKIITSGPITSWQINEEKSRRNDRFYFPGLQNHCRWWLQPWN